MTDVEELVTGHLARRASDAEPHPDVEAVLRGASTFSFDRNERVRVDRRSLLLLTAALALLVAGVVAVAAAQREPVEVTPASPIPPRPAYRWTTAEYRATAASFSIEVGGRTFIADDPEIEVTGDPGTPVYQSLELTWHEHGVEMRWYVYLNSDGNEWWSNEFRTYNGNDPGDWVTFTGDFFRSPLGQPFEGDVDLTATENGITSHLKIDGLSLQPFLEFGPDGATVPTTTQPPAAEDVARAVALSADVPPLPADVRDTGRWWLPEDELVLLVARTTLRRECMADAGFEYDPVPVADWATYIGAWQPNVFLGIRSADAASLGYGDVTFPDPEREYFDSLVAADQQAFEAASQNGCADAAEQVLHESALSSALLGDPQESRMWDAQQMALLDPRVQQAQIEWHECVQAATGDDEPTPNDLARKYLFEGGDPAGNVAAATADIECQRRVDLEGVWYRTVTEYDRSLMGADVGPYDDQVRLLQQTVDLARQVLADRSIDVPPLN